MDRFLKATRVKHGNGSAKLAKTVLSAMLGLASRHGAIGANPLRDVAKVPVSRIGAARALQRADYKQALRSEDARGTGHDGPASSVWRPMSHEREVWIRDLMDRFRRAAKLPQVREHAGYFRFPYGSCTWASFAFGHLLAAKEPDADWHLVNATGPDVLRGHDWLESDGLAVDITADQFPGHKPYVGPIPPPLPPQYVQGKRIELAAWHSPHAAAHETIRGLMDAAGEYESGG